MNHKQKDIFEQAIKDAYRQIATGERTSDVYKDFKSTLSRTGMIVLDVTHETSSGGKFSDRYCKYLVTCARLKYTPFSYDSPYWMAHNSIIGL